MITIGNIENTPLELQIYVYDGSTGEPKACIAMPDDTLLHAELMLEHYLQFSFNYDKKIEFLRTYYVKHNDVRYILRKDYQPQEASLQEYKYTLKFEAPEMLFQDFICFYRFQGYKEAEWTLTGTAQQFLEIAISNINPYLNEDWSIGTIEPTDVINIAFDSQTVFDVLTTVAETFACEWYVDYENKTINLVGHYEHGDIVTLQRDISLIDITRSNDNDKDYCTRLYAFGSTRNIPTNYRGIESGSLVDAIVQKRLRLPVSNGDYIDAFPNMEGKQIIEQVKIFEHIYPKRIGTITELRSVEKKDDNGNPFIIYYFKDSGLKFKSEYIIPGKELRLQFGDNSWLNGRDLELAYNDKTEEFEIINDQSMDLTIPNDVLKPRVGDFYTLYNFDISLVGDQYVGEAEQELLEESNKWMQSTREDNATYSCPVSPVYKVENDFDMRIGRRVRLKSIIFDEGEKLSRVHGYDKYLATYRDTYIVGDKPSYSRLRTIDKTIEENKKQADLQYIEAMNLANSAYKNVKALNYLRTALENETMIDGGLILTTLLRLGAKSGNEWKEAAGISGIYEQDDDVAFWAGGTLEDAINNLANIVLRMDGSGQLAAGNILWDILGNLTVSGKFESNKDGNRIVIDPETRSLKLINSNGSIVGKFYFYDLGSSGSSVGRLDLSLVDSDGNVKASTEIVPNTIHFVEAESGEAYLSTTLLSMKNVDSSKMFEVMAFNSESNLNVMMRGLPTSSSGLPSGSIWVDTSNGNALRVV